MNDTLGTTPPRDLDAERYVLGAMLLDRRVIDDVTDVLHPTDFYQPAHETIHAAILRMARAGEPVDAVTLVDHLLKHGQIRDVGGAPYIHELIASPALVPARAHAYARTVAKHATFRRGLKAGMRTVQLFAAGEGDPAELIETIRAEVDAIDTRTVTGARFIADSIDDTIELLDETPTYHPTKWDDLNHLILGFRPGALYVIGARPGIGKTLFGIEAALTLANHGTVAINSLEMPRSELEMRLIANLAEVPLNRLDQRALQPRDWDKIAAIRGRFADLPISIDDSGTATPTDIRSHARSASRRGPLAGIVVDYLQLMEAPRGDKRDRHLVVGQFSRALKLLAKELQVPVIALSQLNRASETRADKRPSLADLRESGAVEQDSDVVILLHENENDETDIDAFVAKNRHGPRGTAKLTRRGWYARLDPAGRPGTRTAPEQWTPSAAIEGVAS